MTDYLWAKRSETYNNMDFYGVKRPGHDYDLYLGEPEAATWSEDAFAEAQAHSKKKLEDFASTQSSSIICSPKAKKALEAYEPTLTHIEWLPVALQSSSGKPIRKTTYHVLHVIDHLDALDVEASGAEMNSICPEDVDGVKQLVIDFEKIPEGRQIFRLHNFPYVTFVSRQLADYIQAQGLTGMRFGEIEEFGEFSTMGDTF